MRGDEFFAAVAARPPLNRLHPRLVGFLREYLAEERVSRFGDQYVLNTHFPPYPSLAFERLVAALPELGSGSQPRLHSVTLAVTNRCPLRCWHCYNAGRSQQDLPLGLLGELIAALQDRGCVMLALSGGEPLLRADLEQIAAAAGERSCVTVNTTGVGLTEARARALREHGVFAMGISLDTSDPAEHDRLRGRRGAFAAAVRALEFAAAAGLYPYVVTLATRELLAPASFWPFVRFVATTPAREIHLLEPCPAGRLEGNPEVALSAAERRQILAYQREIAPREALPAISSFAHLESADAFGCGAGLTHLYVDGSGEVCPCNLVPLSFGNVARESLEEILGRMRRHFLQPRTHCVAQVLAGHLPAAAPRPTPPAVSAQVCAEHLPEHHPIPRVFAIQQDLPAAGPLELQQAYDRVHADYDAFWVVEAGKPVVELVRRLRLRGRRQLVEVGCGTGFATALLAAGMDADATLTAIDLSAGMLDEARRRVPADARIRFVCADALAWLQGQDATADLLLTTWVLGYIPVAPFLAAAARTVQPGGELAVLVHRRDSPAEPLEIFGELVAAEPGALLRQVWFDFPADTASLRAQMQAAGFRVQDAWSGQVVFGYGSPTQVLEHLLKSGAGTAFDEAIDPARRQALHGRFVEALAQRHPGADHFEVVHDFVAAVATREPDAAAAT